MELAGGKTILGRYKLDRRLGAGGMGEVWAATQIVTRQAVALKFLRSLSESSKDLRRRFLREARAACAVRHPNVVQVHDVLELEDGSPAMVMELLLGESLEARLKRDGRVPLGDVAAILVRVVSAVGTAHALGIVHRDLKPDNIFLAETPEGTEVKVLDFGIAKLTALEGDAAETGGLTDTGAMLGTPYYMSPEQAFGEKRIDHRADIWSLGIILYRALTGILPTRADNIGQIFKIIMTHSIPPLSEVAPELPKDIHDLTAKMLSTNVADRPADLREVKAVLERHAGVFVDSFGAPAAEENVAPSFDGERAPSTVSAVSGGTPGIAGPPKSAAQRPIVRVVAVMAMLAGAFAAYLVFGRRPSPDRAEGPTNTSAPVASTTTAIPTSAASALPIPAPATNTPANEVTVASNPSASAAKSAAPQTSIPKQAVRAGALAPTAAPSEKSSAGKSQPSSEAKPSLGGVIEKPPF